jgi:hypothetical protein
MRVEIVAPREMAPGQTVQLGLRGHFDDGSTADLTARALWQSQQSDVISIDERGRASAHRYGESNIAARTGVNSALTATKEVIVVRPGTFRLSVIVTEVGGRPADAVRVEVVEGTGNGLSDAAPVDGRYDLYGVAGQVLLRITSTAYLEHLERIAVTDHVTIRVELTPFQSPSDIAGTYTLSVNADPACASALLPAARQRTYTAVVRQAGSQVSVFLETGNFIIRGRSYNRFEGRIDGSSKEIAFNLNGFGPDYYDAAYYPDVAEALSPGTLFLVFAGRAVVSILPRALSGRLDGVIQTVQLQFYLPRVVTGECRSGQHSFVLSR